MSVDLEHHRGRPRVNLLRVLRNLFVDECQGCAKIGCVACINQIARDGVKRGDDKLEVQDTLVDDMPILGHRIG